MKLNSQTRRNPSERNENGYIMLTLLLAMALMVIFAGVIVPSITFEIKHDREEEMIHRGVQYSRAIRAYYKKFGRYPTKIEDLESSNNLRFLRKRYKDPLNCKNGTCADFKLLHFGEVQMSLSGFGGGTIPGANPIGANCGWIERWSRRPFAAFHLRRESLVWRKPQFAVRPESADRGHYTDGSRCIPAGIADFYGCEWRESGRAREQQLRKQSVGLRTNHRRADRRSCQRQSDQGFDLPRIQSQKEI